MRRIVLMAGLIGTLVACGGSAGNVKPMHAAETASSAPLPVSLKEPDPDVRRGLRPEYTRTNCAVLKCVALTFDDGPAKETELLLRILARYGVKATFFVVGRMVEENPDILRRELMEGHEIGNHSWSHTSLAALSPDGVRAELGRTQAAIKTHTGRDTTLMRPPYGATNERVAAVARELGLAEIMWAVDPLDWKDRDSVQVRRRVLEQTGPGDIVLLHDIHLSSIEAVPEILAGLAERGYRFVTVSELLAGTPVESGRQYRERSTT
ncbi:polysaccharide deacetylase family protein [Actinocorallia populi]|uniref:polysaccharide deacetylase family protein n=1 Tax=Actinocorallia populi TaxID=2079200 RepID=UPI001E5F3F00|nr:polysaccharide deacetylase family protein [Actinocorallia populi]